jgi:hypothetical protein
VRYNRHSERNGQFRSNPNLQSDSGDLLRNIRTDPANYFQQQHHRNLESGNHQQYRIRNLYLHPGSRPVRCNHQSERYGNPKHNPDIHSHSGFVLRDSGTNPSCHFQQRHRRNMESGYD